MDPNAAQFNEERQEWCWPAWFYTIGGIRADSALPYFGQSPFQDPASVNALLILQSASSLEAQMSINTRQKFETALSRTSGLQYVISHDPSEDGAKPDFQGCFVIRKQYREIERIVQNEQRQDVRIPASLRILGYYYIAGWHIYPAPSFADVLSNKIYAAHKFLSQDMQLMTGLPQYSPTQGHYWTSDILQDQPAPRESGKESTPMPDNLSTATGPTSKKAANNAFGYSFLKQSLDLTLLWKDEYMDENPLEGEPGKFRIHNSKTDKTLVKPDQAAKMPTPLPPPIDTSVANPLAGGAKAQKGGERSPTTPGGTKKRKKSKAASGTTPK